MEISKEAHLEKLQSIREKYNGCAPGRIRSTSEYGASLSSRFDDGKIKNIPIRTRPAERSYLEEHHYNRGQVQVLTSPNDSLRRSSNNKEIERIRQEYAVNRKRVLDDFSRDSRRYPGADLSKDYSK